MIADTSEGLEPGMAVKLSGFRIGKIGTIELVENRRVRVRLKVFEEYIKYVREDTVAKLRGESIIGEQFIELDLDSEGQLSPQLAAHEEIRYDRGETLDEMVESLRGEFMPIVEGLKSLAEALPETLARVDGTIDETTGLITDFRDPDGSLMNTLSTVESSVKELKVLTGSLSSEEGGLMDGVANFNDATASLEKGISELSTEFQKAAEEITLAVVEAGELVGNANETMIELKDMVEKTAPEVPGMVIDGAKAAGKADDVIDSVKNMWPVRGGVPDEGGKVLRAGSDD